MPHLPFRRIQFVTQILFVAALLAGAAHAESDDPIAWARENIAAGKYSDAVDLLQKHLGTLAKDSAKRREPDLVLIEAYRIVGKLAEASVLADELLKLDPNDTESISLKAELDLETGNYKRAREAWDGLIKKDDKNQRAWALRSFVLRVLNDREGLKQTADHFFDLYQKDQAYFNSDKVKDPTELAYVALGVQDEDAKSAFETGYLMAEDLARQRGNKNPEIFLWSARLAHEKYSFANAAKRYAELLTIRPKLPDALAGQASIVLQTQHNLDDVEKVLKEALAVNPNHIESHLLYASIHLEEENAAEAKKHLDAALVVNPNDVHALALQAFYYIDLGQPAKMEEIEKRVLAINPKCSDFYCDIGEIMENKRGFNTAAAYYQKAIDLDPQGWRGYFGLGMNTSRQGAAGEETGKALLLKAFEKNKFNLWALNMIKVLDKIIGDKEQQVPPVYAEFKTRHFTLKCFDKEAAIVAPYLEEWAEFAYERQVKLFGFEPEGPLSIELCYSFTDQAARTVGLPNLGALGVCFGKLCTVVSPREGKGETYPPFNWRKVLEHEFGHVMALQLSNFRVPRWYTEAFSTYLEDDSRIQSDHMMVDAIAKGQLKPIDKMNEYFRVNPLMAYVHGRYVIEYIAKTFGFEAHIKALKLFAQGKSLGDALRQATGKELNELNEQQLAFLKKSFEDVRLRPTFDPPSVVKLELAAKDPNATAQNIVDYAVVQWAMRHPDQAETLAKQALEKDPKCVDAINLIGHLFYEKKDFEHAKQQYLVSTSLDPKKSFSAWHHLAVIYKKEGKTTKAIEAFEAARKSYPRYVGPDNPHHELPDLYEDLEPPQLDKALNVWRDAVKINTEDPEATFKGLELAMKMKDYKAAVEFTNAHIEIDPYKVEVHRMGGKAFEEMKDWPHAVREYTIATAVDDKDIESWIGLARVQKAAGQKEAALKAIEQALDVDATNADAKSLREELNK